MENRLSHNLSNTVHRTLFENIIPFWMKHVVDTENGGFYGRVHNDLLPDPLASKCLILNTRLLWSFSFLANYTMQNKFMQMADRAYDYLMTYFKDQKDGGYFWMLDYKGKLMEGKKKVYGQAFSIYALTEYFRSSKNEEALEEARQVFYLIEKHHYDDQYKGYFETCDKNWSITDEMRLSDTDMNEKKSMNAHLHILEAYTSLYLVWKDSVLKSRIQELVEIFNHQIVDPHSHHLRLFFDEKWNCKSRVISFGHDIEASWLLTEAAEVLEDPLLLEKIQQTGLKLVKATIREGFTKDFGIYSEKREDGSLTPFTDWWQQAEAVVGLINAYTITFEEKYLQLANQAWQYIEKFFIDPSYGEWFYEVSTGGLPNPERFKVSEWKGPYHNSRACVEILERLKKNNWLELGRKKTG